mmetsp:Transcript_30707/g.65371  ORF Transcript_30707/g.65371 Transcript_30707/m.65371 type:complete len:201 (+) Transcript_30707:1290-1892(+)
MACRMLPDRWLLLLFPLHRTSASRLGQHQIQHAERWQVSTMPSGMPHLCRDFAKEQHMALPLLLAQPRCSTSQAERPRSLASPAGHNHSAASPAGCSCSLASPLAVSCHHWRCSWVVAAACKADDQVALPHLILPCSATSRAVSPPRRARLLAPLVPTALPPGVGRHFWIVHRHTLASGVLPALPRDCQGGPAQLFPGKD